MGWNIYIGAEETRTLQYHKVGEPLKVTFYHRVRNFGHSQNLIKETDFDAWIHTSDLIE